MAVQVQTNTVNSRMSKNVPTGIKILSILYYIGTVFCALFGLLFIFGGSIAGSIVSKFSTDLGVFGAILGGVLVVAGILFIAFSVLSFFIARGLWKIQNWARIVAGIFAIIGALGSISSIIQGQFGSIVTLAIEGFIVYYLFINKEVKAAFK